ncbi:hypothetical protein EUTSA_v10027458mg, partial [Eutrema salsugineum]
FTVRMLLGQLIVTFSVKILYKTPIESLVRFKSICKQWYALINDKRFIYKHFYLSQKRFILVNRRDNSVQLFDYETQAISSLQGPTKIQTVIHCDGVEVSGTTGYKHEKLAVWNPFLSQIEWIEPSHSYKWSDVYGFGYDKVSRDKYKILRLLDKSHIEIYEFKSKLWRSVDAALDSCVDLWFPHYQALSINGNMYWIARRKKKGNSDDQREIFIQSFDFSRETFKDKGGVVPFETEFLRVSPDSKLVMSGLGGDRISLLRLHEGEKVEVWVTNKVTYDGVFSWSKCFHITRPDVPTSYCSFPTYFMDKNTSKLMLCCGQLDVKKQCIDVNVYEIGEGDIKKHDVAGFRDRMIYAFLNCYYVYVPSLVPVPE